MTFEEYLNKKYTRGTIEVYLHSVQMMKDTIGKEVVDTARFKTIMDYIDRLRKKDYTGGSINTQLAGIKVYYEYLVKEGIIHLILVKVRILLTQVLLRGFYQTFLLKS